MSFARQHTKKKKITSFRCRQKKNHKNQLNNEKSKDLDNKHVINMTI